MSTLAPKDLALSITLSLRAAFGGDSPVSDKTIGAAIFGHANNASVSWTWEYLSEVIDTAAALTFAKWEECGARLDEVRASIVEGYRDARAARRTHAPRL